MEAKPVITMDMTLREIAELPLIKPLFPSFILHADLSQEPIYDRTLREGEAVGSWVTKCVAEGLNRLYRQLETGNCVYPLYTEEEIAEEPEKREAQLLWFPSDDPLADERPFMLIVPGGAYVNVCSVTEGYPIADGFNREGLHAFVLTYRTNIPKLFPRPLEDIARALRLIRERESLFRVRAEDYVMAGFSAGGNLILNWAMLRHGWPVYGLPRPKALVPVYPAVTWKARDTVGEEMAQMTFGMSAAELALSDWNVEEHVEGFPPCYITCCEDDDVVDPEHSRMLKRALDAAGIPAVLEMGEKGGHGFASGSRADTWGWIERAAAFCLQHR